MTCESISITYKLYFAIVVIDSYDNDRVEIVPPMTLSFKQIQYGAYRTVTLAYN